MRFGININEKLSLNFFKKYYVIKNNNINHLFKNKQEYFALSSS